MLDLARLFRVPSVDPDTGFDLSPDGTKIAFSWNPSGQWEIYEKSLVSTTQPVRLTVGSGGKFAPHYSPDGRHLGYMVDLEGGENYHLFLYDFATGIHRDLTPDIDCTLQPSFDWSPDGRWAAILSNQTGCFSAYILDIEDLTLRLVLENGFPAMEARWSPAGDWLAIRAETGGQDYGIFLIPLQGGAAIQVSDRGVSLKRPRSLLVTRWGCFGLLLGYGWVIQCWDISSGLRAGHLVDS